MQGSEIAGQGQQMMPKIIRIELGGAWLGRSQLD